MITNQERRAIAKMMRRTQIAIGDDAAKLTDGYPLELREAIPQAIIAQNVMRDLMTAVFMETAPFGQIFCEEMALRLASYAISAAPIEDQSLMVDRVTKRLPGVHTERLRQGFVIETQWREGTSTRQNIPARGDVQ